jgi:hypothetical protein
MTKNDSDKRRQGKLTKRFKAAKSGSARMSAKQVQELSIMKAREEASVMEIPQDKLIEIRNYLRGQAELGRATKADLARLMVIEERCLTIKKDK